jgi:hypothetical protein
VFAFCLWDVDRSFLPNEKSFSTTSSEHTKCAGVNGLNLEDFHKLKRQHVGGLSVCWDSRNVYHIRFPLGSRPLPIPGSSLSRSELWARIHKIMFSAPCVISYDLKTQLKLLRACGIPYLSGQLMDPAVAYWLADTARGPITLQQLESRVIHGLPPAITDKEPTVELAIMCSTQSEAADHVRISLDAMRRQRSFFTKDVLSYEFLSLMCLQFVPLILNLMIFFVR